MWEEGARQEDGREKTGVAHFHLVALKRGCEGVRVGLEKGKEAVPHEAKKVGPNSEDTDFISSKSCQDIRIRIARRGYC